MTLYISGIIAFIGLSLLVIVKFDTDHGATVIGWILVAGAAVFGFGMAGTLDSATYEYEPITHYEVINYRLVAVDNEGGRTRSSGLAKYVEMIKDTSNKVYFRCGVNSYGFVVERNVTVLTPVQQKGIKCRKVKK